jgi:hypothetical protein
MSWEETQFVIWFWCRIVVVAVLGYTISTLHDHDTVTLLRGPGFQAIGSFNAIFLPSVANVWPSSVTAALEVARTNVASSCIQPQ